jgi:serine/threonine-protein kinase
MVAVPTVKGSTQAAATAALAGAQFGSPRVTDAYSDTVPSGLVISSTPAAGQTVSHLTTVALVVSEGPQPVSIPDEKGATLADAERTLKSLDLKAAVRQDFSDTVPAGTVINASPSSGTGHRGDTVALDVSKGPALVTLPNLGVYDGNQADQVLRQLGLVPREIALFGIHGGAVVTQSPEAGSRVRIGSTVTFYTAY